MVFGMFNRAKRGPMLPSRDDLEDVIKELAPLDDRVEAKETGLVNYVLRLGKPDATARTNVSFYLSERNGTRFWKCALVHGWQKVHCNDGELSTLQTVAKTDALSPAVLADTAAGMPFGFGAEPAGYKVDFHDGDVDYSWVFELEPYRWQEQVSAMYRSWETKIGELDGQIRKVWVRNGMA